MSGEGGELPGRGGEDGGTQVAAEGDTASWVDGLSGSRSTSIGYGARTPTVTPCLIELNSFRSVITCYDFMMYFLV